MSRAAYAGAAPGPDSFGYTVVPTTNYSFVPITNGTATRVLAFNDDAAATASLGFNFNFYGTNYSTVSFNVNGMMTFVTPSEEYANVNLTTTSPTNNQPTIAVLWDDWETQETWADAVYYKTSGTAPFRQFIVQWNKVVPVNGDGTNTVTFEAILFEGSNRILCSYFDTVVSDETTNAASLGAGATVGIRDRNGQTNGRNLQWSFNQSIVTNGMNLLFAVTNHAPVATNDTVTTLEDIPATISVLANDSDQDGDQLTIIAFTQGANGAVTQNSSTTLKYSPTTNFFGSDSFAYTISDGAGGSATGMVSVTVSPVNDPPTLNALANLTLDEDSGQQVINLTGITSGAANESDTISITATSSVPTLIPVPAVAYISPNSTGTLSFASVTNGFGTATITVTVNDGQPSNNIVSRSFAVTINAVNDPPTLDPIADVTVDEDSGLQTVNLTGVSQGASNESDILTLTATSNNTNLLPSLTTSYNLLLGTGRVRFTPAPNAFGTAVVTVTLNDGQPSNNIVSHSFTVTVNPVNDAPTLNSLSDLTLNEDAGIQNISLLGISSGAANENDTLTITAASNNTNLIANPTIIYTSPDSTGTLSFASISNAFGVATLTVTVNDGQPSNNIVSRSFTVIVNPNSLTINSITRLTNGHVTLHFPGMPGRSYSVEGSGDLTNWTSLGAAVETNSGQFDFEDATAVNASWRFYRLRSL